MIQFYIYTHAYIPIPTPFLYSVQYSSTTQYHVYLCRMQPGLPQHSRVALSIPNTASVVRTCLADSKRRCSLYYRTQRQGVHPALPHNCSSLLTDTNDVIILALVFLVSGNGERTMRCRTSVLVINIRCIVCQVCHLGIMEYKSTDIC